MSAYSKDLRLKVLAAVDRGVPRKEVAEVFGVSLATIKRWLKLRRETGGVEAKPIPGRPSVKGKALRDWLPEQLKDNPDLTLEEHREAFEEEYKGGSIEVSTASVSRAIARLPGGSGRSKKVAPSPRARRGGALGLARAGRRGRPEAVRVDRRVRDAHLHDAPPSAGTQGRAGIRQGAQEPRQEHDADRFDGPRRGDRRLDGRRRGDRQGGL